MSDDKTANASPAEKGKPEKDTNQAGHNGGDANPTTAEKGTPEGEAKQAGSNGGDADTTTDKRDAPEALVLLLVLALVIIGAQFYGKLKADAPEPTPPPRGTLGLAVALPGDRFPDNAAFLKAGDPIDLLVFPGGATPEWTAQAVVVAVATGTRTAVQVDVHASVAATLRALLNEGNVAFQYIPATATPTKTPLPTCGTATPMPAGEETATPKPTGKATATPKPLPTCEATATATLDATGTAAAAATGTADTVAATATAEATPTLTPIPTAEAVAPTSTP